MAQVKNNQESQRLQYALVDTAKAYGFQQVEIIDCDMGMSAATGAQARDGFNRAANKRPNTANSAGVCPPVMSPTH